MLESISATDIAVGAIKAQRIRMNVIANNIANALTTRTPQGGPFRRQLAIFRGEQIGPTLKPEKFGVWVKEIVADRSPFRQVYDPTHPDANEDGIVLYPNVNLAVEMINLLSAQRAYEASIDVIMTDRSMGEKALEIIQQ
ncbi:MAG: flagellar basal body rod protein FlgC [Candidatus Hydrogenedentes bacterium]|nr:flagellar basal body rod protein FlgC [Candidatus Hydrogenedentota bacterium]